MQYQSRRKHPDCTDKDKADLDRKIEEANANILERNEQEYCRKEMDAIKKIKTEPKEFFRHANKNKNTRSRIGPLKSGNHTTVARRKWHVY